MPYCPAALTVFSDIVAQIKRRLDIVDVPAR